MKEDIFVNVALNQMEKCTALLLSVFIRMRLNSNLNNPVVIVCNKGFPLGVRNNIVD